MKCINAAQILPEDLLAEIRRYTNGERLLYIPEESRRKGWLPEFLPETKRRNEPFI